MPAEANPIPMSMSYFHFDAVMNAYDYCKLDKLMLSPHNDNVSIASTHVILLGWPQMLEGWLCQTRPLRCPQKTRNPSL